MADKKKKKTSKSPKAKRTPVAKPKAKKTTGAGQRSERANVAKKPAKKVQAKKPTAAPKAKQAPPKKPAKFLKHSDKEEMTVINGKNGKNGININITPKRQAKPQKAVSTARRSRGRVSTVIYHIKYD